MKYRLLTFVFCYWFLSFSFVEAKDSQDFPLNKTLIKKIKQQGTALISDRVGAYILRAEDLAKNKKFNKAIDLLEHHYKRERFTKSEKAYFAMNLAYLYQRSKKTKQALLYLKKALDLKALSYSQHLLVLYNLAHIYAEKENYSKAIEILKHWFSINENPYPSAYILLAHCYYAKNQIETALKYVEKTLSSARKPLESWLQFAVAIYLKKKQYEKAQPYLEKLVALYPARASHWTQLVGVYLYLDKNDYAFVTLDMADKMGYLKRENQYLNLSSLYVEEKMPYQGAKLLRKKISENLVSKKQKHLELLAEAFWFAREEKQALIHLKEASKKSVEPRFFIRYGQRLLNQEEWIEAEKVFRKALETKEMQDVIKNIQKYKMDLALANRKKNNLKQKFLLKDQKNAFKPLNNTKEAGLSSENTQIPSLKAQLLKAPSTKNLENIYLGIGIALYQKEKYEKALFYFKKSIEVDDTFLGGYQWIDYAETSLSKKRKAKKEEQKIRN